MIVMQKKGNKSFIVTKPSISNTVNEQKSKFIISTIMRTYNIHRKGSLDDNFFVEKLFLTSWLLSSANLTHISRDIVKQNKKYVKRHVLKITIN